LLAISQALKESGYNKFDIFKASLILFAEIICIKIDRHVKSNNW
jgi:hypothetical protein